MNTTIQIGIRPQPRGPCHAPSISFGDPDAPQSMRLRVTRTREMCVALVVIMAALVAVPVLAEEGTTLAALEIAYGRERNAFADRLAFAAEAEREGHCEAACLFRASATAESIHAVRLAAAIEQLDARPVWALASVVVRSTAENLQACLERELDERDRVYTRFDQYAREECLYDAAAAVQYARVAGGTEVAMFQAALERLNNVQTPPAIAMASTDDIELGAAENCAATYYLCPGDGSLFSSPIAKGCPNCGTRGSRMLVLSCITGGRAGTELTGRVAVR
jgi:rubrerythrin